jgi:hypothetical protein
MSITRPTVKGGPTVFSMGVLDKVGLGKDDDRRRGLVEVRLSQHACPRCGCMVALDLAAEHRSWHGLLDGEPPVPRD